MPSAKEYTELEKYREKIRDKMKGKLIDLRSGFYSAKKYNNYSSMGQYVAQLKLVLYFMEDFGLISWIEMQTHLGEVDEL